MDKDAMTTEGKTWQLGPYDDNFGTWVYAKDSAVKALGLNGHTTLGFHVGGVGDEGTVNHVLSILNALESQAARGALADEMAQEIVRNQGSVIPTAFYVLPAPFINGWLKARYALKSSEAGHD